MTKSKCRQGRNPGVNSGQRGRLYTALIRSQQIRRSLPMYKIIGADNVEYGPVSGAQIRQWINEGRANSQTRIRVEGSTDWKSLSEYPEFADVTAGSIPTPPP